ncbi:family 3 encapsulin nanocompartment shell protein [Spirillospora sp. NPDC047279]|uniref:family 3 encapsulin nanocompartment shell protein n=1 Tax=Spirillospora sp. NPDC047279 TaxID=3155478 RepID=UPI0033F1E4DF
MSAQPVPNGAPDTAHRPPNAQTAVPAAATPAVAPPVAADPAAPSPGRELAAVLAAASPGASEVALDLPLTLTTTFPFFAARPRYTVRHLLGARDLDGDEQAWYVSEPIRSDTPAQSGVSYASSPESAFEPRLESAGLTEVRVAVPLPDGLTGHPDLFGAYVDRRVVVRLCTAENEVLLHGSADEAVTGLLNVRGRRTARGRGGLAADVAWAAALVEETGGSCDGMVVHPDVYWRLTLDGRLTHLNAVGVRVSRTRMIDRHQALFGDFRAVATLLDPARSRLVLRRGGDGAPDVVEAYCQVGLAVHLPQHLVLADLGEALR